MSAIRATERHVENLRVYVSEPEGGARGGMLVLPSARGIDSQLRQWADDIAGAGVTAVVWDPFHGDDVAGRSFEDLMPLLARITDPNAQAEQRQLLNYMHETLGLQTVGTIGWCLGGRLALVLAARETRIACCVAYHPTVRRPAPPNQTEDAIALSREIHCPVQMIVPGADQVVPQPIFAELRQMLESRERHATDVQFYPGAAHAFMVEREANEANRIATQLAWPQTLAFIQTIVR